MENFHCLPCQLSTGFFSGCKRAQKACTTLTFMVISLELLNKPDPKTHGNQQTAAVAPAGF